MHVCLSLPLHSFDPQTALCVPGKPGRTLGTMPMLVSETDAEEA